MRLVCADIYAVVPLKLYAPLNSPGVAIAPLIVPLFAYCETSFTVLAFSHNAVTLSKLYINFNPESYTEYGVPFRV